METRTIRSTTPSVRAEESRIETRKRKPLRGLRWATYLLIAFTVGRVVDIVPALTSLPLVKVVLVYIVFALFVNRKLLPPVMTSGNPAIKWAMVLAAWIVVSFSFSIWLGPSRDFILVQLPLLCAIVWVVCKLSVDWASLRSLFFALLVAAMILAIPGLFTYSGGRLEVQSSYDTNDLAYVLIGAMPTALAFGVTTASRTRRLLFYGSVAIMVLAVALTGSRGGMLGLLCVVVFIVLDPGKLRPRDTTSRFPAGRKPRPRAVARIVLSLAACVLIGIAIWPQLPPETQDRLSTLVNLGSDYNVNEDEGRLQIWKRGMEALARRPIGYGINTYGMVDLNFGGRFYTAHNSFVLVVVELGPVGLVLYLGMLAHVWRGLVRIRRKLTGLSEPTEQEQQQAIFCRMLQAGLIGNVVAGQFLSATYFYAHWVNIAIAISFIGLFGRETSEPSLERKTVFGS